MMRVADFDREEFLTRRFRYELGEHLGAWSPTQDGKTHFTYQMLDVAMIQNPGLRVASLMPKSRDPASWQWAEALDLRITDRWPPARPLFAAKPRGHLFWPKHLRNVPVARNREHLATQFRTVLGEQFREGDSITLADDVYNLAVLLGLNMDLEEFWTAGSGGGAGLWAPSQKPSGTISGGSVSSFSYNAPTHLVFGKDTDRRNVKRFAEIGGGIDPELVAYLVATLKVYRIQTPGGIKNISQKLYIHKGGPYMCRVGP